MRRTALAITLLVACGLASGSAAHAFVPAENTSGGTTEAARIMMEKSPPTAEASAQWATFKTQFGENWEAVWNPATRTPHRVFGQGVRIAESVTDANIRSLVDGFVEANSEVLGVDTAALRLISSEKHGARWYTDYQQTFNGIDVVGGRVHVRLKEDGKVTVFGSDFYQDVSISTMPSLREEDAFVLVKDATNFDPRTDEVLSSKLVVLPVTRGSEVAYHLAYEQRLRVTEGPALWRIHIDANDGRILRQENEIRFDAIYGTVSGGIKPMYITEPDTVMFFADHAVSVTGYGQDTTDTGGNYSIEAGTGGMREVAALMRGRWARVTNNNGAEASFSDSVAPGAMEDILWRNSNSLQSERNAYYHTGVVHAKIKDIDPSFTGMDRQTPVRVNEPDYCNAYWDGNGMTFGAGTGSCNDLAMFCDVVYHEYGHGITDFQYRPLSPSGAMHEAFSDYIACTITNEPYIGEGIFAGSYFRNCDNDLRYPEDLTGGVHDDGRILAGALWHMREALAPDIRLSDSLFHFARYAKADNFIDYYYDVLETDDDDGDLSNGTPHFYEIAGAFGRHGIGPGIFIDIAHMKIGDSEDSTVTYPVVAAITSNLVLNPDSLLLYYSTGGGYTQLTMLPTANPDEYSATIPAQPYGAVVTYYIYTRALDYDEIQTDPDGAPASVHTFTIGVDSEAPVIAHTAMGDQPDAAWPADVIAEVTDNLGLASVVLEYTKNGAPQTPVPMTNDPGTDDYGATFGVSTSAGDVIEYRLVATDASAASNIAYDPPAGYYTFGIAAADYYDFETGEAGWTHRTTSGWVDEWHLSTDRNHTDGGGTSWKCGSSTGGDYANNSKGLLETPTFVVEENAKFVFWHWMDAETYEPVQGSGIAWDGGGISFVDSANSASPMEPIGGYPYRMMPGSSAPFTDNKPVYSGQHDWEMAVFELPSDYAGSCYIRFKFGSDGAVTAEGWYIDDAMIWSGDVLSGIDVCDDDCDDLVEIPARFALGLAVPNPTPGKLGIAYAVPSPGSHVSIGIYDVTGRLTSTLVNEQTAPGRYTARWDGRNSDGSEVSPGIYFIRMQASEFRAASKVILLR